MPSTERPPGGDLLAVGADLEPGTLLAAYRTGLFPMHVEPWDERRLGWWSPDPRGVLRSLRRSLRRFTITVDTCFDR
jgi:leucyl/phenylalanyl-tRNA---protein transferase